VLLITAALALGLPAGGRADGPAVVDRGHSGDVHWTQRARARGSRVTTELTLRVAGRAPSTRVSSARLGDAQPVAWFVEHDVGLGDRQLLEATTSRTVDHLRLEFDDGTARQITPSGRLAGYRFYVLVLPQQPATMRLLAIDRRGDTIESIALAAPATSA
jgi:hypothetical protein